MAIEQPLVFIWSEKKNCTVLTCIRRNRKNNYAY